MQSLFNDFATRHSKSIDGTLCDTTVVHHMQVGCLWAFTVCTHRTQHRTQQDFIIPNHSVSGAVEDIIEKLKNKTVVS